MVRTVKISTMTDMFQSTRDSQDLSRDLGYRRLDRFVRWDERLTSHQREDRKDRYVTNESMAPYVSYMRHP